MEYNKLIFWVLIGYVIYGQFTTAKGCSYAQRDVPEWEMLQNNYGHSQNTGYIEAQFSILLNFC